MDKYCEIVSKELESINKILANIIDNDLFVYRELKSFLNGPSKRIRSILGLLYLKANNADIIQNHLTLLAAGELIHNGSLLHDDVIDGAEKRRGEKTIAAKISNKAAILAGDYLISIAVQQILKLKNDKITEIFSECTKKMSEAELIQMSLNFQKTSAEEYIKICEGKTASLFTAILESAAILSGTDIYNAKELGKNFGVLFQIKNDLNLQSAKNDLKNGTMTAKDIFGIEKTNTLIDNYKEEIANIVNIFPNDKYVSEIKELSESV